MATIAFDSSDAHDTARAPISRHPAFPAVVALWFAALLGLGSMVLPVVLLERVVEAVGLPALIPAAAAPLGFMARGLIALAAAILGAALGVVIARRVARAHDGEPPSRAAKFANGARRPIDVNEELGGEPVVNGFGLPVNRRRALAIAEDDRPSDFLYMAPLPGNSADGEDPLPFDEQLAVPRAADEPLELSDSLEDAGETDTGVTAGMSDEFEPAFEPPHAEARQEFVPVPAKAEPEPLPFSAPSLARRAAEETEQPAVPAAREPQGLEFAPTDPEAQPARADWETAPLDELGLVQLAQRLGAALGRRREWLAAQSVATPAPPPAIGAGLEPAAADEAAEAMATYFARPAAAIEPQPAADQAEAGDRAVAQAAPAPLSSLAAWAGVDEDDETDAMPSFSLPLRQPVAPTIAFEAAAAPASPDDDAEDDDSYSSLLAMRNPFAARPSGYVRIDEPEAGDDAVEPAVVFPGHGDAPRPFDPPPGATPASGPQASPADADAALRAALATLQRMSGTA